jgi:hypothetical protein
MVPRVVGDNTVAIGPYTTTLNALVAARPGGGEEAPLEFSVTHQGWRILPLKLYRPLIYYAAFGSDDVMACLRAAMMSLLELGRWRYDIAILTRPEDLAKVSATVADLRPKGRLHLVTVPAADVLDWCLARYKVNASKIFANHQPIIYSDIDVICDAPLDRFCIQLADCRGIEVLPEGRLDEGEPDSSGHWFGWRLMAADNVAFDPCEPGFSSGILGFANLSVVGHAFSAILRSAYCHAEQIGSRHHFGGYDQPFACYIMKKFGLISHQLLPGFARSCRVDPALSPLPVPANRGGLVHFNGIVGDALSKRKAMEHYLSLVLAGKEPPSPEVPSI